MPRPFRCRRVAFLPGVTYFKPAGRSLRELEEVQLTVEEVEAIRLKDLEGLEQEEGAVRMNISRPTFQRILASARQKIADALFNGKAIRIEGGNYQVAPVALHCLSGHEWKVALETVPKGETLFCPVCGLPAVDLPQTGPPGPGTGRHGWHGGR